MLRVGLTGELGSGKSTVARLLAERGALVMSSDEIGRAMMQPGEPVFRAIVEQFGPGVLTSDGTLNRPELARLAFDPEHPRVQELNAIVHPAVIAEQERRIAEIARGQPQAIVVVESALIFSTNSAGGAWQNRFDQIVLVTAPDEVKLERFVNRMAAGRRLTELERKTLREDARQRLAAQRLSPEDASGCLLLANDGGIEDLREKTEGLWNRLIMLLRTLANRSS